MAVSTQRRNGAKTQENSEENSAMALRLAAQSLWRSQDYLGECFRRWKARLGTPKAITAMAHKLARVLWHLIKHPQPYDPSVWAAAEKNSSKRKSNASNKTPPPSASNSFHLSNLRP